MRLPLLLAFLVLAPLAAAAEEREAPTTIRVLCYNIHYGQGTDEVYDVERLARVIREAGPDLVALQEVDVGVLRSGRVHQARELARLTGMSVRYGPTQHYQGGLFGNAVLSRLPILDVAIHPLPYTEPTEEKVTYPRGAIAVTVEAPDGKPLRFISTHFQHNLEEDRIAEAEAVNTLFAKPGAVRSILAGDINATPDSPPLEILLGKWKTLLEDPPAPTAPSVKPRVRIDYIFTLAREGARFVSSEVIAEPIASDHLPVLAVIELKPD